MGADNPGWMPPQAGAVRAVPTALTLMARARARKHDADLSNRLTGQGVGVLGRGAVLTIIGLHRAGKLPECGAPAREEAIGLARAGDAGIGAVIFIRHHEYVGQDRDARGRVMAWPAAGCGVLAAGGRRGEEDEQA